MFRPISCMICFIVLLVVVVAGGNQAAFAQDRFYTVHVSSCQLPENAEQEVSSLKGRGLEAFSRHETVPGKGMWYRIYVGRFNTSQEAAQYGTRIKSQGIVTYTEVRPITGYGVAKTAQAPTSQGQQYDSLLQAAPSASQTRQPMTEASTTSPQPVSPTPEAVMESPEPAEPIEPEASVQAGEGVYGSGDSTPYWASSSSYRGPFTLTTKAGATFWGSVDGFTVRTSSGGTKREFWIDDSRAFHFAVVPSYRVYDFVSVDGSLELMKSGNISGWYMTLGAKASWEYEENFAPYVRAGLVYGMVNWDGLPGDFESGVGWEAGIGLDYLYEQLRFGAELQYRSILFDYNAPAGVNASASELDLSGFSLSGSFGYNF